MNEARQSTQLPATLSLVVGLGECGGRAVRGLRTEPPFSDLDDQTERRLGRMTLLEKDPYGMPDLVVPTVVDPARYLAGRIVRRLELMLQHRNVQDARCDAGSWQAATEVVVALVGDASEESVRVSLQPILEAFDQLITERLAPIFRRESGARGALSVVPLIALPPASHPRKGDATHAIAELGEAIAGGKLPSTSVLYLLESVTDLSILEPTDLEVQFQSFCLFTIEALASLDPDSVASSHQDEVVRYGDKTARLILGKGKPAHPFGTVSIARADPRTADVREFATCQYALRVVDQIRSAAADVTDEDGRAGIEDSTEQLIDIAPPIDIVETSERLVQLPDEARQPAWHEFRQRILAEFGPDTSDPIDEAAVQMEESLWVEGQVQRFLQLQRRLFETGGFEGVVERLQQAIGRWETGHGTDEPGVVEVLLHEVDRRLIPPGRIDPAAPRLAAQWTRHVQQSLERRMRAAVTRRDAVTQLEPPNGSTIAPAHSELMRATRDVPPTRPYVAIFVAVFLALWGFFPATLSGVAARLGTQAGEVLHLLCIEHRTLSGGVLALLVSFGLGWWLFAERLKKARQALDDQNAALRGEYQRLRRYMAGCVEYAWDVSRIGALTRVREALATDLGRLESMDRALVGAQDRYFERIARLGLTPEGQTCGDAGSVFAGTRKPLVWPLVPPAAVQQELASHPDRPDAGDVLEHCRSMLQNWRSELPFLRDAVLDAAVAREVDRLVGTDFWRDSGPLRETASRQLGYFGHTHQRSLPQALHAQVAHDEWAIEGLLGGEAAARLAHAEKEGEPALGRMAKLHHGAETDRVYAVRIAANISADAVVDLRMSGSPHGGSV